MSAQEGMATDQRRMLGGILAIVGGALVALGAFLPWIKATAALVGTITRSGMEGVDGPIFLVAGLIIAALGLWSVMGGPKAVPALLILGGLTVGGLAFLEYSDVSERTGGLNDFVIASVGAGIWCLFAGAASSIVAGLILVGQMRVAATPPDNPVVPATGTALSPGRGAVRTCPHCKEAMRRDAGVCPHCRLESPAWEFQEGRWWTQDPVGTRVWFDESQRRWRRGETL